MADYPLADEVESRQGNMARRSDHILLTLADILGQSAARALLRATSRPRIFGPLSGEARKATLTRIATDEMETNLIGVNDEPRRKAMQQRIMAGDAHRTLP